MTITNRLISLKSQHDELEKMLEDNMQTPASSDSDIASLKKQKLALKDEINKLEGRG